MTESPGSNTEPAEEPAITTHTSRFPTSSSTLVVVHIHHTHLLQVTGSTAMHVAVRATIIVMDHVTAGGLGQLVEAGTILKQLADARRDQFNAL